MMMMIKERKDMKPFIVKFGVALALSFAGFLYSRIRTKRIKPSNPPPPPFSECEMEVDYDGRLKVNDDDLQSELDTVETSDKPCIRVHVDSSSKHASPNGGRYSGDRDVYLLPEFNQVVKEFDTRNLSKTEMGSFAVNKEFPESLRTVERDDYEQEIESLKRRIQFLVERERKLEVQLLEYYGLKEQETVMRELQNRLKIHSIEAKLFMMKIENLEAENKRLVAKVADYSKVVTELEAAKAKIRHLKRKIRDETEHNKEQIFGLAQRVMKLQEHEHEHEISSSHSDDQSDVHRVAELEAEAEGLRKCNKYLQQENAELAQRLESTQILANTLFEDPERQELHQVMRQLREDNEKLKTEVERLQADRCADSEELVYLRWINACLRYELRNYQPPPGKTVARDLSKCLSPTSEKKAKKLILEYATTEDGEGRDPGLLDVDFDPWSFSNPSYLTDCTDQDEFSGPGSSHKPHSKKVKFFSSLRKLVRGISSHHHHHNHNDNNNQNSQTSPMYRSRSVGDIGKRFYEAGQFGSKSNPQSPKFASSSQNSNNSSLEYQRLASLAEEDENTNRMSHSRSSSSPPGGVRFVLGRESMEDSFLVHHTPEWMSHSGRKSDLAKYADVLRDTSGFPKHKKSASYHAG